MLRTRSLSFATRIALCRSSVYCLSRAREPYSRNCRDDRSPQIEDPRTEYRSAEIGVACRRNVRALWRYSRNYRCASFAATPKPILEKLNAASRLALIDPKVIRNFEQTDFSVFPEQEQTIAAANSFLEREIVRWGQVVRTNHIEAEQ